ncbi:MAG TPA: cupin domain-containing protein [Steroidobacteraceae bacterium]
MNSPIVLLDDAFPPEVSPPPAERVIAGQPITRIWNVFADPTQQFFAGRWSASRGKWRIRYTENELCVMTCGKVVIESDAGERRTFSIGDAFVVPAGFSGTWEVLEDCSKIYAIFEHRPG